MCMHMYMHIYTDIKQLMCESLENDTTIWTKGWEITGLYHFIWRKNKENCLKNTEKLQINVQQIAKKLLLHETSLIIFIFK